MSVMNHQVVQYHLHFHHHLNQLMIFYKCLFLIDLIIFVVYFGLMQAYVCHVQRIAQARCPVVRFCHKQQKVFCELSINNQYVFSSYIA